MFLKFLNTKVLGIIRLERGQEQRCIKLCITIHLGEGTGNSRRALIRGGEPLVIGRCREIVTYRRDTDSGSLNPVQLIARHLGIHHILIDNECRALGVVRDPLADLTIDVLVCCVSGFEDGSTYRMGPNCRRGRRVPLV
ncbi:unnamed protein product [Sphagnum balticum]